MLNIEFDLTKGSGQITSLKQEIMGLATAAETASQQIKTALNFKASKDNGLVTLAAEFSVLGKQLLPVKQRLDSVVESVKYLKENTVNLVSALKQATAANKAMADSQLKQAKSAAEAAESAAKSAGATREEVKAKSEAERILKKYSTTQQKQNQDMERLSQLVKQGAVDQSVYDKALENVTASQKKNSKETKDAAAAAKQLAADNKTAEAAARKLAKEVDFANNEITRFTDALKKQNSESAKTSVQLMSMKGGWKELAKEEQIAAISTLRVNEAFKLLAPSMKTVMTPAQQYMESVKALNLLQQEYVNTSKKVGVSEREAAEIKKRLRAAYLESAKALKTGVVALTEEQQAYARAKESIESHLASLSKSNQEFGKTAMQILKMNVAWDDMENSQKIAAYRTVALHEAMALVSGDLQRVLTPAQKYMEKINALSLLKKEYIATLGKEGVAEKDVARLRLLYIQSYLEARKARSGNTASISEEQKAIEKGKQALIDYTAAMEKSNAAFGKNSQEVLKLRTGWGALNVDQQKAAMSAAAVGSAFQTLGSYISRVQTPSEKYREIMAAIEVAKRRYIKTLGEEGISLTKLDQITKLVTEDYRKEEAALLSLSNTVSKYDSAIAKSKADLLSHLSALRQSNSEFGKSKLQIMQASLGWDKLSTSQQRALTSQQKYADTMGRVHSILGRVKNDADIAAKAIADLDRALAIGNKTGGRRGITQAQHTAGVKVVNDELEANKVKTLGAAHATKIFTANTGLANQATAGFRAALMGANLGFGMFTSSTVLTAASMFGLAKALTFTVTAGAAFEVAFERAAVVMDEFGSATDGTLGTLSGKALMVQDLILDLAENTQYGTVEVARAAGVLAQAGLEPIEVFNALAPSLQLAAIGMVDVAEAADIAVGVMYGFGKTSEDLGHIVDVMAQTTVMSNLNLKQVAKTMEYIAPVAKQMGMTVEDAAAAVAILGNASIKGSKAGTSLRAILVRATAASKPAAQAFTDLGIKIEDFTQGGVLNLQRLFALLDKKGASVTQMKAIMGQWAITAAFALTELADKADKSGRSWDRYAEKLRNVEGVAAEMAAGLRKNLTGAVEDLTSVMETIATRAFGNYGQDLEDQVRRLTNFIKENQTEIVSTLTAVMRALLSIFTTIVEWSGTISELLQMFIAFKVVRSVMAGVIGVVSLLGVAAERSATSNTKLAVSLGQVALGEVAVARAAMGTAAVTSASVLKVGGAVAGAAGLIGGALRILTGPLGILLTLGSIGLPYLLEWMFTEDPGVIREYADAIEKFNTAMETTESGFSQTSLMDVKTLRGLRNDLMESLREEKDVVRGLTEDYSELALSISDMSSPVVPVGEDVNLAPKLLELKKLSGEISEANLRVEATNYKIAESQGTVEAAILSHSLALRAKNDLQDQGLKGQELIEKTMARYASEMLQASKAADGLAIALGGVVDAFSFLSNIGLASDDRVSFFDKLRARFSAMAGDLRGRTPEGPEGDGHAASAAAAEAEAAIKAQVSALESQIKAYEKSTVSVTEYNQKLREVTDTQKFITSGSKAASEKLKELGMTAAEAMDAMKVNKDDILTEYFAGVLTKVDARYKDLGKTVDLVGTGLVDSESAFKLLQEAILKLDPASRQIATALLNTLKPALESVANGNAKLAADFKKLSEEAALMWAKLGAPSGLDALIAQYKGVGQGLTESTIASIRFGEIFGDSVKKSVTEAQTISEASRVLKILSKELDTAGLSAEDLAILMEDLEATLPTGALLKSNENIQNQTALMLAGVDSLDLYNAAWEATNGHLERVTDEFIAAKKANTAFQKQLEQIQQVREVYEQFGDGLSKIFTDLFTGGIKSFKDFADRLKSLFKQMIADLIAMALKNSIFNAMFGTGGNTAGLFQAVAGVAGNAGGNNQANPMQMLTNMFGNGGTANTPANNLGMSNNLISRFFGGGGGGNTGTSGSWLTRLFGGGGGSATASGFIGMGNVGNQPLAGLGGNFGTWAPAGTASGGGFSLGAALPYAGAALGGMYGLTNRGVSTGSAGSLAAGAAYGVGGLALGTVGMYALAGGAGAAGMGAGAMASGAMGGASMGAAAIPVAGWIIAAVAAIDMITGGKVFGTRYKPESSTSTTSIGEDGGTASATIREVRQRSLFRGRQWRNRSVEVDPEAQDAAEELFDSIQEVLANSARQLRVEAPPMIDAAIRSVTEYDSKGKVKTTKLFVDILGRTWEEATSELAASRITGEAIIYAIDEALGYTFETVADTVTTSVDDAGNIIETGVGDIFDNIVKTVDDGAAEGAQTMGEASTIAERWRDDAENLLDGAQFLLMAATDMRNGLSLFEENAPGILTQTADLIEELAYSNETLQEAYVRVRDSVSITERTLGGFGVELGRTRSEFITFSAELVESLGGIDAATQKLNAFSEAFGSIADMGDYTATQATTNRATLMTGIGLDPGTSAAEFIAAFTAGIAEMAPEVAAQWINAGMALVPIHNSLEALRQQAEATDDPLQQARDSVAESIEQLRQLGATPEELAQAWVYGNQIIQKVIDDLREQLSDFMGGIEEQIADLNGTEYENQLTSISRAMHDNMEQARNMGASLADLARIEALAALQIQRLNEDRARQLSDMMHGIEGQISQFEGRTFIYAMQNIRREMAENVRQATALGASTAQLARIQQLAAYQIAQVMADLRAAIEGLVEQLYGQDAQDQVQTFSQYQSSASAQQQAESEVTNDLEQKRYDAAQDAIKKIDEYLKGLRMGDQSPGGWRERLDAARVNFEDIYARAMEGDPEAMAQLSQAADDYLRMAQQAYGPGVNYANIFGDVEDMLRAFQAYAATIQPPTDPSDTGGGGFNDENSGSSGTNGNNDPGMTAQERYRLALQLAQNIGELGLALDVSVFDLMREFGIDIEGLAGDLGIDLSHLTVDMADNLRLMASALGVPIGDLIAELGISSQQLGEMFGVSLTSFSESNLTALAAMSEALGISVFEGMNLLGMDLEELATSFGIDIAHLNSGMGAQLVSLAGMLGVTLGELSTALGLSLTDLATAFGVSVTELSSSSLAGLTAMAAALGVSVGDLVTQLGISLVDLAASVGIDIEAMNANTVTQLTALAGTLGMSVMALIGALGIDLRALATSFGVDLSLMDSNAYARFVEFAEALGLNIFQLAEALSLDIETFTGAFVRSMNEGLEEIPDLPPEIKEALRPLLADIASATTASGASAAISALGTFISGLPTGIQGSLSSLFTSLGGIVTTAAAVVPVSTADYQTYSLAAQNATASSTASIVTSINGLSDTLFTGFDDITEAIGTSIGNAASAIVAAIVGPPEPPPPSTASLMAYWAIEDSQAGGASDFYNEQSEESAKRVEEAIALSMQSAENLKKVEEKLEEVVVVLEDKFEGLKQSQEATNEKLTKISKNTTQLNEKSK